MKNSYKKTKNYAFEKWSNWALVLLSVSTVLPGKVYSSVALKCASAFAAAFNQDPAGLFSKAGISAAIVLLIISIAGVSFLAISAHAVCVLKHRVFGKIA